MDVNGRDESGTKTEQSPKAPTVGTEDLSPQFKVVPEPTYCYAKRE